MFAIRTPIGTIVHSGDFKIDYTPISGDIMDLQRIAQIGREGVLLFVCESTNIEVPGFSKSERHVGESMAEMFEGARGRIFVATFSSNIYRLQPILSSTMQFLRISDSLTVRCLKMILFLKLISLSERNS